MNSFSRRDVLKTGGAAVCAIAIGRTVPALAMTGVTPSAVNAGTLTMGGDMTVNRIGYGAFRIGSVVSGELEVRSNLDVAQGAKLLRRVIELGINFIDTADVHGFGDAEERIRQALYPYPKDLVIATKGGWLRPGFGSDVMDGSPKHMRQACESSLKRLGLERIDLYQHHTPDPKVPIEETMGEFVRLQKDGKIRHIGVSNYSLEQLKRACSVAPVVSVQNLYNVGYRASEDVLRYCEEHGLAFISYKPLGVDMPPGTSIDPALQSAPRWEEGLAEVQTRHGLGKPEAAIAWLVSRSPRILPIPSTSSMRHLESNVAAAAVRLSKEEMIAIG